MIIGYKYKLLTLIGRGSFGSVYTGENIRTGKMVAIKVEPLNNETKLLKNETKIYHYLNRELVEGIPQVKWFGSDANNYYMVLNLLGPSLEYLLEKKKTFSLHTVLSIGIQIIYRLQHLHKNGLIHRDVKPDNFLVGLGENRNMIYIIDFGFCKTIDDSDTNTNASLPKKRETILGTPKFASINVHKMMDPDITDDIESLGYMLIYFYLGKLEWDSPTYISNEDICKMKETFVEREKENTNIPTILLDFLSFVQNMDTNMNSSSYAALINLLQETNK